MNNTIDTLIDSAFAKDKDTLPLQPAEPDAALLSKLGATAPLSSTAIDTAGTTLLGIGTSKFLFGFAGLLVIGSLFYALTGSSVEQSAPGNPMIFLSQDSVKPKKPADTIHMKEVTIKEKMMQAGALRTELPSDSMPLIYPQGTAKKYPSDSTGLPIRK